MDKVIIVDKNDRHQGLADKVRAHTIQPKLHRAITCFLFDSSNNILIQKRSKRKLLWPFKWDTSCSTHPKDGESYRQAAQRRLREELRIKKNTQLKLIDKFEYHARYKNIGSENELCALLVGNINPKSLKPNKREIAEIKFISLTELKTEIKKRPSEYTPWLKIALKRLRLKL